MGKRSVLLCALIIHVLILSPVVYGGEGVLDIQGKKMHLDGNSRLIVIEEDVVGIYGPWRLEAERGEYHEEPRQLLLTGGVTIQGSGDRAGIFLEAQGATAFLNEEKIRSVGNVSLKWDDLFIKAEKMEFHMEGKWLVAEDRVQISYQDDIEATCGTVLFYSEEERILLKDGARITQGNNTFLGDEITLYLKDKKILATGNTRLQIKGVGTLK